MIPIARYTPRYAEAEERHEPRGTDDRIGATIMRYWWVNQNQTFRQEQDGGYIWSPKRNANGAKNPFYEAMREVSPGDVVFAFFNTFIAAIGMARSYCWESPKPLEFGSTGQNWSGVGWKVRVHFHRLVNHVRPKDHIDVLRPLLPEHYGPLQESGNGKQGVYLAEITSAFADVLAGIIGVEAQTLIKGLQIAAPKQANDDLDYWEHKIESSIDGDVSIPVTEREAIIRARRGQGLFKQRVMEIEKRCRITGVTNPVHLIASHCKPWRDATNAERLDGENGLLLTPSIDHLFDRGFIGFENNGSLIVSPVVHQPSLQRMGITTTGPVNVGTFTTGQQRFLEFHRDMVLLKSAR